MMPLSFSTMLKASTGSGKMLELRLTAGGGWTQEQSRYQRWVGARLGVGLTQHCLSSPSEECSARVDGEVAGDKIVGLIQSIGKAYSKYVESERYGADLEVRRRALQGEDAYLHCEDQSNDVIRHFESCH